VPPVADGEGKFTYVLTIKDDQLEIGGKVV
jgi:hypothetical protein